MSYETSLILTDVVNKSSEKGFMDFFGKMDKPLFWSTGLFVLVITLIGYFFPEPFSKITQMLQDKISTNFGWYYMLLLVLYLAMGVYIVFSKCGISSWARTQTNPSLLFINGCPCSSAAPSAPDLSSGALQNLCTTGNRPLTWLNPGALTLSLWPIKSLFSTGASMDGWYLPLPAQLLLFRPIAMGNP